MKRKREANTGFWTLIVCIPLLMFVAACGGNNNTAPAPAPAPAPTDGTGAGTGQAPVTEPAPDTGATEDEAVALYEANCMGCHAADLSGQGSFPALTGVGSRLTLDEITKVISAGGSMMPAFEGRLSDEEIQILANWLAANK